MSQFPSFSVPMEEQRASRSLHRCHHLSPLAPYYRSTLTFSTSDSFLLLLRSLLRWRGRLPPPPLDHDSARLGSCCSCCTQQIPNGVGIRVSSGKSPYESFGSAVSEIQMRHWPTAVWGMTKPAERTRAREGSVRITVHQEIRAFA